VLVQDGDGTDPPVVLVHGGMDRSSSFGRVVRKLPDVPLVRYDRRGYGRSVEVPVGPLTRHVDDLLAVIGRRPAVVFGHSVGGVIALIAAQRRPDLVLAVLSYESPMPWLPWWPRDPTRPLPAGAPGADDEAEAFMRRMVGDRIWERLPARTRADRRAEGEALRADLRSLHTLEPAYDASAITVPVLSAAGTESSRTQRRAAEELATALPRGYFELVEGADHGVHLSRPGAAAELVLELRALALGPGGGR
jgi:pimeloyl-ACP methyl ester carboxylesterase